MLLFVLFMLMWSDKDGCLALNVAPKVMLPASPVRTLKGYKLSCSVTGTAPIQTKVMWNSTMMAKTNTSNGATIQLNKEGKYACEATNPHGSDKKEVSVKFTDCGPLCSQGYGEWYSDYYSQWGNTLSCSNVMSPADIRNCAPSIVDVLYLSKSNLNNLPVNMFSGFTNLEHLFLKSSNIRDLHEDLFTGLTNLLQLDLSMNAISSIPVRLFSNLPQLNSLNLSSNIIETIHPDVFSALTNLTYLSLSHNRMKKPHANLFLNLKNLQYLDLSYNHIDNLTDTLFCCVKSLQYLFLQHNRIPAITNNTFGHAVNLKYLLLSNNYIGIIPEEAFKNNRQKLEILVLNDNEVQAIEKNAISLGDDLPPEGLIIYMIRTNLPEINLYSFHGFRQSDSHEMIMNDELIGYLRYYTKATNRDLCKIYLNPNASTTKEISITGKIYEKARLTMVIAFLELGFQQAAHRYDHENFTHHYSLSPCPEGTYSLGTQGCQLCPPGGYLSDSAAFVATECQECPVGAYVKLDIFPGTRHKHCRACPRGTNTNQQAGLIACTCLEGFYRTHIFGKCEECKRGGEHEGLDCEKTDFLDLKPGYWWEWQNDTHKERYKNFTHNLIEPVASFDNTFRDFTFPMPKPTKCPREESCQGGVASLVNPCKPGYEGPVCGICQFGYYKQLQSCSECPTKKWMAIQLGILLGCILIIVAIMAWYGKKQKTKKAQGRALIDVVFARLKIIIGFYQVTYGLLEAFAFVRWPDVLEDIAQYSEILQLNILQIAPLHCMFSSLHVDAFGSLFASMGLNAAAIAFFGFIYFVRYLIVSASHSLDEEEKAKRLSHTKELVLRNLLFFLFVTYLSTCSKTANVLPLACRELCRDKEETLCDDYLKADYGIRCHGKRYHLLLIGAYINILYIIALPAISILVLWRERLYILATKDGTPNPQPSRNKELVFGLTFLFENYTSKSWYWELVEMARKISLTSGLILIGQESRAYVGVTCVLAGLYGMLFAFRVPIKDHFENKMMVTSLAVTFINLGIGAVSRIPAENREPSKDPLMDTVMFKITVLGANTLVIGQLIVEYISYILRFLRDWIKHPHWSFACLQNLLLPVNDLQEDTGFVDEEQEMDEEQGEKMEMFSLSIDELGDDPAANDNKAFAMRRASDEDDDAFAIRRAPKEEEALAMHPAAKQNEAFVVGPGEIDRGVGMFHVGSAVAKAKRGFTSGHSAGKVNEAFGDSPTKKDHLAIDVIPEDNEGEERDVNTLEERDGLDQDAELDGQFQEEEVEEEEPEEPPVEMCDQEVQTDLTTLEMGEDELYELFGEPQDESIWNPQTDQDSGEGDSISQDTETTPEQEMDQGDSFSLEDKDTTLEPEMDHGNSISPGKEPTPEPEMGKSDSSSPDKEPTPKPEMNQDNTNLTSALTLTNISI
ncbi:hypothetical protein ACROYT_G031814 [Oculina patagonica]